MDNFLLCQQNKHLLFTDGGKLWKPIARSISYYPQTYSWNLPQVSSNQCLIKIEDYFTPTDSDISDVPFSITSTTSSSLQLISPIGGEKWGTTSEQLIKWNKTGSISKVRIRYSRTMVHPGLMLILQQKTQVLITGYYLIII